MTPDGEKRLSRLLEKSIDWKYLLNATTYHGILSLISWHFNQIAVTGVPDTIREQFKYRSNAVALTNLTLTAELLELSMQLQNAGIRALPFKGPILAATVYGNLSFRQFCDLDILVNKADMLKAKEVLLKRGFEPLLDLHGSEEGSYLETHHDYKFVRPRDAIVVEIQWGITEWSFHFPLDFEKLWARRIESLMAGKKLATLLPEDLLLVLCVHGAKHQWGRLKWICDIAEVIAAHRSAIDWHRLIDSSRNRGGERMLLLGVYLAHALLDAELPENILERIKADVRIPGLARQVIKRLFRNDLEIETFGEERPFFYWKCRERLHDKLAIGWRYAPEYLRRFFVPNSHDRAAVELSPYLSFGYYFVHPVRLIKQQMHNHLRGRSTSGNGSARPENDRDTDRV